MTEPKTKLEAQTKQRAISRRATLEQLRNKKRAEREIFVRLSADEEPVSFLFRALGGQDYDKLVTKCPATTEQVAQGGTYDPERFAPMLLSRVCVEPALDEAEWKELWTSTDWSRGEAGDLFFAAVQLCNKGLDVGPTAAG